MTPRQFEVISFIKEYRRVCGYSPSLRQIARRYGVSVKSAGDVVKRLVQQGAILHEPNTKRAFVPADEAPPEFLDIPIGDDVTPSQRAVLEAIRRYIREHRVSPTLREISFSLGFVSVNSIHYQMKKLLQKGYIKYPIATGPRVPRSIMLARPEASRCPPSNAIQPSSSATRGGSSRVTT